MIPTSLSLVLWLSYSGAPQVTNAEVALAMDLPSWVCEHAAHAPAGAMPELFERLGAPGQSAKTLLLRKKKKHPGMIWGLRCISIEGA